jgi:hypothetical protein
MLSMVTGCATSKPMITESPISGTKWEGTVVSKPYSTPRTKMVSDIIKNVKGADDEYAIQFVSSIIDKEISPTEVVTFADNSDCQSKMDYLLQKTTPIVNELPRSVNYILKHNTATGTSVQPSINNSVSTTKQGKDLFRQQLSSDMVWSWAGGKGQASGYAKININFKVTCDEKNNASYKVTIPDYIISNPTLWLGGQSIAELSVDWTSVRRSMDSIGKEYVFRDGKSEYEALVNRVGGNINSKLADRFFKLDHKKSKNEERIYKVALDVMSSRIQRRLEAYKFTTDKTRYEFLDKVAYHSTSVDLKTIVKVFPEEGGKTSVVFSLEYSPIHDALTKKISFGENEAQKYLLGQISTFEKLIASL